MSALFPLRPLQQRALDLLRDSIRRGARRIVVQAPTGFGKTIVGAHIVNGALAKGKRAAFTVPTLPLVDQTFARFAANGIEPHDMGVMQGDHAWRRPHAPLQICSVQTVDRRGFPETDLVLVDECHVRYRAIDRWMDARPDLLFVGLSATPWSRGMGERWQDLVIPATIKELILAGWLSKFRVFAPSHPDLSGIKEVAGDYHEGQLSERMSGKTIVADVVKNWLDNGEDRPTLCFAVDRAHAATLHGEFAAMGVASAYVDGDTSREERGEILARFQAGAVKVIVSIGTMTTGVDVDCRCIILARPTKSEILYTQMVGRGLRIADGKDHCLIFDHSDTTQRLGLVTSIHRDTLRTDAGDAEEKRRRAEGDEREPPKPRECSQCHYLMPAGLKVCPSCGHVAARPSTVQVAEGELVEIGADGPTKKTKRDKLAEPEFYAQLQGFAEERGYKPGWAANKFREKYGVWPNGPHVKDVKPALCGSEVRSWVRSRQIAWANSRNNPGRQAA